MFTKGAKLNLSFGTNEEFEYKGVTYTFKHYGQHYIYFDSDWYDGVWFKVGRTKFFYRECAGSMDKYAHPRFYINDDYYSLDLDGIPTDFRHVYNNMLEAINAYDAMVDKRRMEERRKEQEKERLRLQKAKLEMEIDKVKAEQRRNSSNPFVLAYQLAKDIMEIVK